MLVNDKTAKEQRNALRSHYATALADLLHRAPTRYERAMFSGIIRRLKGQNSSIARPLFPKTGIMECMRPWAEKRGLL